MIAHCYLYESGQVDPHVNLALEKCLLEAVRPGQVILYLWQNDRTVVIGRNQNAYDECDVAALEADGGKLARRLSGGGAVYNDLGNLNFTFILPSDEWDLDAQTDVLVRALKPFGIVAERTGRNDLTIGGRKFSGHAYYHHGDKSYHHGTLMVCVDPEQLARYLTASPLKLGATGVASVRSRVMNLIDAAPDIEIDNLKEELIGAFTSVFGLLVEPFPEDRIDRAALAEKIARHRSREWLLREERTLDHTRQGRFDWGTVRIGWSIADGAISAVSLFSDSLEADAVAAIPDALVGCPAERAALEERIGPLCTNPDMARDIAALIV